MKFGSFLLSLLLVLPWKLIQKHRRVLLKITAGLILALLLNLIAGCFYYKATTSYQPAAEELSQLSDLGKKFIVHRNFDAYQVTTVRFSEDSVQLFVSRSYYVEGQDISPMKPDGVKRYRKKKGDARLLNEVHLYVKPGVRMKDQYWQVAYSDIERLDVYNHSTGHTISYSVLFGLAMVPVAYVAVVALFLLVMLLTGNSCPFIYTWDGQDFAFAGEIYSGAVYPPLERHDYLYLPDLVPKEGQYELKISNQLEEIQHTNLLEILAFDHPAGKTVLVDKYGQAHLLNQGMAPSKAFSLEGENVLPLVKEQDDLIYLGKDPSKDPPLLDGLVLEFDRSHPDQKALLMLEAKNSFWLDFVYQNFRSMLGASYQMWTKRQKEGDPDSMESWSLSQHIPLAVYLWKNGEWVFQDYFHTVGPMAFKTDILELDLQGIDEENIRIKLESGAYFWEIESVAIFRESGPAPEARVLKAVEAITETGVPVLEELWYDDDLYYLQPEIGNEAVVKFPAPPVHEARTLILHSKGHYDILQDPKGLPRLKTLNEIRQPGNFNDYSRELMQNMLEEHIWAYGPESY